MKPIRLTRPGRAGNEGGGELELVSTQMLKQILTSRRGDDRLAIEDVANTAGDGVLVLDTARGRYEILDEDEFKRLFGKLKKKPHLTRPADVTERPLCDYAERDHFSLVTSRALRRVLGHGDTAASAESPGADFNPYRLD